LLTLSARTDLKVRGAIRIDIGGKEEFVGVVSNRHPVDELHHGQTVIEDLEGRFLSFPLEYMTHNEHSLALPLGAKIAQRMLRRGCAGELTAGTGSDRRHGGC